MWFWFKLWSICHWAISLSLLLFQYPCPPLPLFIQCFLSTRLHPRPINHRLLIVFFIIYFSGYLNSSTWLPQIIPAVVITFIPSPNTVFCHLPLPSSCFTLLHTPAHHFYSSGHTGRKEEAKVKQLKRKMCTKTIFEILANARFSSVVYCRDKRCECDASPSLVGCMSQRQALSLSYADRKSKREDKVRNESLWKGPQVDDKVKGICTEEWVRAWYPVSGVWRLVRGPAVTRELQNEWVPLVHVRGKDGELRERQIC